MPEISAIQEKQIVYPPGKTTWAQRWPHLMATQETLRREHNTKGQDVRDGKLSLEDFRTYQREVFGPKQDAVSQAISDIKHTPDATDLSDVDLDTGFEDTP